MADRTMSPDRARLRGVLTICGLLLALVALWVGPLLFAPELGDDAFPGADAQAITMVEATGYEPWLEPVFNPGGEIASGVFALQAAIGAGVLFYVIGYFHGRSRADRTAGRGGGPATDERGEA